MRESSIRNVALLGRVCLPHCKGGAERATKTRLRTRVPHFRAVPRSWTTEQAVSLAPDAAALKTAQGVASPRKWTSLGQDEDFVWGLAQGWGAQPYQVQIDLTEPIGFELLPQKFPLSELQRLYETIIEQRLDKRNFRKKILSMGLLADPEEIQQDVAHRAARLYRFDEPAYRRLKKAGFNFEL